MLENYLRAFLLRRIRMTLFSIIKCWHRLSGSVIPSVRLLVRQSTCPKLPRLTFDEACGTAWAVSKSRLILSSHAGGRPAPFSKAYPRRYSSARLAPIRTIPAQEHFDATDIAFQNFPHRRSFFLANLARIRDIVSFDRAKPHRL